MPSSVSSAGIKASGLLIILVLSMAALGQIATAPPLSIARQGYLFAGGKYSTVNGKQVLMGQLYVEFQIPSKKTHPYPIVMVHGGTRTGTTYTGTPDGRESWAQYFARRGHAVYVVDQPGRGRSGYLTEAYGPQISGGESSCTVRVSAALWSPTRISRLPEWLGCETTPSSSMRSMSRAARL